VGLVDLVDRVLDLCAEDPGYRFLLDGQTVVLEDYLEIRPGRRDELAGRCAEGRIAIGPWYVQPDSLLPSGEAHVRNLLLGRLVGEAIGPVSREGYTPDSFGHPAQFPQLLAGFGIRSFVYWRGHGDELDALDAENLWEGPDGSTVLACHLGRAYFNAGTPPGADPEESGERIAATAKELAALTKSDVVLLLNGIDHAPPEPRTHELARAIESASGLTVERGLLEDYVDGVEAAGPARQRFHGELVGARMSPLLPGVWSTRTWIKIENRRAEMALEGWAEPAAAWARRFGLRDERPALHGAWKSLLQNQAHDSICGCSRDEVHEQMRPRFDAARELAEQTTTRCLERLSGLDAARVPPWSTEFEIAVWNPSPHPHTDLVRFPLDFHPYAVPHPDPRRAIHPTVLQDLSKMHFLVDDVPARMVPAEIGRTKLIPERGVFDLEFVATDVPALGCKRFQLTQALEGASTGDVEENVVPGTDDACIEAGPVRVELHADGRFDVFFGEKVFRDLGGLESIGDRGDSYDFDPVDAGPGLGAPTLEATRRSHPSGIQELCVRQRRTLPTGLSEDRSERAESLTSLELEMTLRVAPGLERVDLELGLTDPAHDHRLRLLFPTARLGTDDPFDAATTFDVAQRRPGPQAGENWVQAAPATFPHQGFVAAGGLCIGAPGLSEAEVVPGDPAVVAITLLRCVGSLSRQDLKTRPGLAGPGTDTPRAQCTEPLQARLFLQPNADLGSVRAAELGLRAVCAGPEPSAATGMQLELEGAGLVLSALKPAAIGDGTIVRVLNPTDQPATAILRFAHGFESAEAVRLDETPNDEPLEQSEATLRFPVPGHALRSIRVFDL
jgi:hypothetical protein